MAVGVGIGVGVSVATGVGVSVCGAGVGVVVGGIGVGVDVDSVGAPPHPASNNITSIKPNTCCNSLLLFTVLLLCLLKVIVCLTGISHINS